MREWWNGGEEGRRGRGLTVAAGSGAGIRIIALEILGCMKVAVVAAAGLVRSARFAGRMLAVGCSRAGCNSGARAGLGSRRFGCRGWTFSAF